MDQGLGTVEFLRQRREWLKAEIDQIDLMLLASTSKKPGRKPEQVQSLPTTIEWAPKIDEVFENYDGELNYKRLSKKLVELGLKEANDGKYKGSILACLSRRTKQGKLERVGTGVYRRKKTKAKELINLMSPNQNQGQNSEGSGIEVPEPSL